MQITEVVRGLGLKAKETDVYLALLELGEAKVGQIAEKSGVKRPTAYLVLQDLEKSGFVSRTSRGKKIFFSPQHPRKLVTEAEVRLKELKEVVPQLESLLQRGEGRPRVTIYEGKEKLDRAYDEAFSVRGEVLFMSSLGLSAEIFPRTFKKLNFYMISSPEFRVRELIDESEEGKAYAAQHRGSFREVKMIPKELLPFEVDIGIFGNKTLITSVKREYFTVSIESEEIAKSFRSIFEAMWRAAKE